MPRPIARMSPGDVPAKNADTAEITAVIRKSKPTKISGAVNTVRCRALRLHLEIHGNKNSAIGKYMMSEPKNDKPTKTSKRAT
jgi:hypothetical protein